MSKPTDMAKTVERQHDTGRYSGATCARALGPSAAQVGWSGSDPLWNRMRETWATTGRIRVEECLTDTELAACDEETLIDLAYCEFCLRIESGELPTIEEYAERFPAIEAPLRKQFEVHQGLIEVLADPADTPCAQPGAGVSASQPQLPDSIGKYRVIEQLGSGAQADVYRAVHPMLGRDVVVKLYRTPFPDNAHRNDRFLTEGRLLAQLNHPNLVRLYDVAFEQDCPYLVMEYIAGEDLQQRASRGPLAPRLAAVVVATIARAVHMAHKKGITHRDIKPANIVIDERGEPHLFDFGLSQLTNVWNPAIAENASISGTLGYMAPEQARGETAAIDHRADIFALGGVLYYLLVGKAPYSGDSAASVLVQAQQCRWDRQALQQNSTSARLRAICEKAMAAIREDRYSSADQMARELETCAARPAKSGRRVAFATVTCVILAVVAVWSLWGLLTTSSKDALGPIGGEPGLEQQDVASSPTVAFTGFAVQVWRAGRFFDLVEVVPAYADDEFQITAEMPAGVNAALFLINGAGEVRHLRSLEADGASRTLRYPVKEGYAAPLVGPSGTECLFVCGRRSGAIELEHIQRAWIAGDSWPALSEHSVLRLSNDGVHAVQRSRDFGAPVPRSDPEAEVRRRLETFLSRLQAEVDCIEGVVYSHRERQ